MQSNITLYLIEAYSGATGTYKVIGVYRNSVDLEEDLRAMDPKNLLKVRVSILQSEIITGPHGRRYYTGVEMAQ